jgi:hypothetical protein
MNPLDKIPGEGDDPPELRDEETLTEWAEEDRQIEDRKPDLGEIEKDPSGI